MNRQTGEVLRYIQILGRLLPLTFILVYPLLFIWQGLDFTDTGYVLSNYQLIFREPSSVAGSFKIWLSNILGGIWVHFFGDSLGLLGYRLAAVLLVYLTLYFVYLTLKPYIKAQLLYWGLFFALVFINRSGYQLNYNSFTALFYVIAAYFLIKGLVQDKIFKVLTAGFFLGLNIFVRLPNVLGFALICAVFFYGYLQKHQWSKQIRQAVYFTAGYVLAIVVTVLVMHFMGHLEAYIAAFLSTFTMLQDPVGHHRSDKLISTLVHHHKTIFERLTRLIAGLAALALSLSLTRRLGVKFLQYALIVSVVLFTITFYYGASQNWVNMLLITVGSLYLGLVFLTFCGPSINSQSRDNGYRLLSLVALVILIVAPLGSNVTLRNSIYGMYLAIPLVFGFLMGLAEVHVNFASFSGRLKGLGIQVHKDELSLFKALAALTFLCFTVQSAYLYNYRDSSNRFEMIYSIDHQRLKGVYTTKERAKVVEELLEQLPHYVREDDYLLAYEQIPMVYFLTKTKPYLYSAWPMLYGPEQFKVVLWQAVEERPYLPVIVRARGDSEDFQWPKSRSPLVQTPYHALNRQAMEDFITSNHYQRVWQNSFFEVLVPPDYQLNKKSRLNR